MKAPSIPSKFPDKILLITGGELRHQYFINQLNAQFPLAAVLVESFDYPEPEAKSEEEKNAWNWFFLRRKKYENQMFKNTTSLPTLNTPPKIEIGKGQLNSEETLKIINNIHPDLIIIFGTSLLKSRLIHLYQGKILNLHVGLPEHYRGSSCNFWPIHNGRLECLGASIHKVNEGIDSGDIVAQGRIPLELEDDEQTLAGKTLMLGCQLMVSTVLDWRKRTLKTLPRKNTGKLCLMRDFTPKAVLKVRKMVESGEMIKQIKRLNQENRNKSTAPF